MTTSEPKSSPEADEFKKCERCKNTLTTGTYRWICKHTAPLCCHCKSSINRWSCCKKCVERDHVDDYGDDYDDRGY